MIQNDNFQVDAEISLREIQNNDLKQFKQLLLCFYTEIDHGFSSDNLEEILRKFLEKGMIILAIDNDTNKIIGFISCIESSAIYARGNFGVINELYIVPEFRSRKIGQRLIDFIIGIAQKNNWSRLELDTPEVEKSEKTIHFYKKEGFVPIGYRMKKTIV
jgi:GNAT superfamily N-acetyltransferase